MWFAVGSDNGSWTVVCGTWGDWFGQKGHQIGRLTNENGHCEACLFAVTSSVGAVGLNWVKLKLQNNTIINKYANTNTNFYFLLSFLLLKENRKTTSLVDNFVLLKENNVQ